MGVFTTQGYRGKLVDKLTGTILDQYADEDIKVSNNILELFDLGEIPGTYTQQITLPGTKKNNAFFEQYYDISVWEPDIFNTNQVVEAYLDFDAFYLVNGYLQLNKVNVVENKFVDSYEVTLFGIISNFSIDTKTSFLTDLSTLNVYNHTASYDNISSSWNRQLFNGDIVYPMGEYGQKIYYSVIDFDGIDDNTNALVVQDYKPAIRLKKVWDACFNEFGYTYTGSFWSEPFLNNTYLTLNNNLRAPVFNPSIETYGQGKVSNVSGSAPISLTAATSASFVFNSLAYDYNNKFAIGGGFTKYTVDQKTTLDMTLDLAFKVTHTGGAGSGMPAWYIVWVNDSTGLVQDTQVLAGPINNYITTIRDSRVTTTTETFNLKGVPIVSATLPTGTYRIYIRYEVYGTANFSVQLNPDASNLCQLTINRVRQAGDQQVIDIPSNMPFGTSGIKVMDFIRGIQKKFNLVIYPDKLNPNQFVVETFNNWYRQGSIKDFNRYINVANKISFTPANQLGYNKVRFSDADDTDYISTLFKRTNNRVYGESNFYDSGSYYSQGTLDVTTTLAQGTLGQVPGSVYTGSVASSPVGYTCTTYELLNSSYSSPITISYQRCSDNSPIAAVIYPQGIIQVCARDSAVPYDVFSTGYLNVSYAGDCTPAPTDSAASGSGYPMWIPYYIADAQYTPARVLPRLLFYNGLVNVSPYWIQGYYDSTKSTVQSNRQTKYPYFDVYSTGSLNDTASVYPQLDSKSLLFNNEQAVWGNTPTASLVSEYYDKYLALLYNPRTRLVDATAVIPLADYFNIELNDIAEFRGNYYHLRAINDYNLTTGEANIQMLGPIIPDALSPLLQPATGSCAFQVSVGNPNANQSYTFGYVNGNYPGVSFGPMQLMNDANDEVLSFGNFNCYNGNTAWDIVKFGFDGIYDSTFNTTVGTSGSEGLHFSYSGSQIYGVAKYPTGSKYIVTGPFNRWNDVAINPFNGAGNIRINPDGTQDTSYSGFIITPFFSEYIPTNTAVWDTGKSIVGDQSMGAWVQYPDGAYSASVDSLGGSGRSLMMTYSGSYNSYAKEALLLNQFGGGSSPLQKLNENGKRTAGFATNDYSGGPRPALSGSNDQGPYIYGGAVQPGDGKILVVGMWDSYGAQNIKGIVRLEANGDLDTSFHFSTTGSGFYTGSAVYVQDDGNILFAVQNSITTKLYRLTNSGSVDLEFFVETGSYSGRIDWPPTYGQTSKIITSVIQSSDTNVLALGPAFTNLNGTNVTGWTQKFSSTSGYKINQNSNSC